ncbi:related to U2 snRNP protein A` [Ustilago sp. UG-2017b]|nr:related to U2 snRNP protein A` [Ustilago sp. UG-2017b]
MKLTPELLSRSSSSINHLQDRSVDLRGLKIPAIENLGVTRDQNDSIDFTDNDIRYLGNFPLLRQLKHLLLSNNLISRIDPRLPFSLPSLHSLTLTNNSISDLSELVHLAKCSKLEHLTLMGNPVGREQHYRNFVIWKLPQVRVLDFQRIRDKERQLAKELMETQDGRPSALAVKLMGGDKMSGDKMDVDSAVAGKESTFEPGRSNGSRKRFLTREERKAIQEAIEKSESLEEIRRLEEQLKMGHAFLGSS